MTDKEIKLKDFNKKEIDFLKNEFKNRAKETFHLNLDDGIDELISKMLKADFPFKEGYEFTIPFTLLIKTEDIFKMLERKIIKFPR